MNVSLVGNEATQIGPSLEKAALRDIPSLDGLRAVSIVIVLIGHAYWIFPRAVQQSVLFKTVIGGGVRGVQIFFVISGYLITSLLIREFEKTGNVAIARFYFRRSLRIFPPFYVFMGVIFTLMILGKVSVDRASAIAAATYTWALYPNVHAWIISHTWSLSIEEFFYLFWPILFVYSYRRGWKLRVPIILIAVMPFIRLAIYLGPKFLDGRDPHKVQWWLDTMMIGCSLAILEHMPQWVVFRRRHLGARAVTFLALCAFILIPLVGELLPPKAAGAFGLLAGNQLSAVCMAGIIIYMIEHPGSYVGSLLNLRWVRHIGVMSYSLYLWQQIFMYEDYHLLPWGILYAVLCAEISFWLVEKPSLRLRATLEKRLFRGAPTSI